MPLEELRERLGGVGFTNPTPFTPDGDAVDHDALAEHVAWLVEAGARLVIPCGNTGEYYSLSNDERIAVVETVVDATGSDASVVAGVGGSGKTALELLEGYGAAGVDGIMIMHPIHTYIHRHGLRDYYRRIVEATDTDVGVVLYKRGPEITGDLVADLVEYENVVGVKYAVNDIKSFSADVTGIDGDIAWINGIAERFAPAFAIEGADGFTTGIGNFLPRESLALMAALRAEDWDRARWIRELFRPYEDLREESGEDNTFVAANNVPVVKHGLELAGHYGGPVRPPITELSTADRERATSMYRRITAADIG